MSRNNASAPIPGFSKRLRDFREASGYSLDALAKKLNISKSGLRNYEIGKAEPGLSTLVRISEILEVSVDDLLGISGLEKPSKLKNKVLSELQNTIELISKVSVGKNSQTTKTLISDTIRTFTNLIRLNINCVNTPDKDKNLSIFETTVSAMNSLLEGKEPTSNPYWRLSVENNIQYQNIKLLRDFLTILYDYFDSGKQEYATANEFFNRINELRRKLHSLEDQLEQNSFLFPKIKDNK